MNTYLVCIDIYVYPCVNYGNGWSIIECKITREKEKEKDAINLHVRYIDNTN